MKLLQDCVNKGLPPPPAALGTMFELDNQISIKSLKYLNPTTPPTINLIPTRCPKYIKYEFFYNSDYESNDDVYTFHEKYKGNIMVKY